MLNKLSLTLFAAAVCFAQPHGMGRHGTPSFTGIKAYLNLSDTQVTSITAANSAARESNRAVHEQLRAKHDALQTALKAGSADAAAIGRQMLEIQALRKQTDSNRAKVHEQAVSFLSAEQKTKLAALASDRSLRRELREAHALQLLAPPADGAGPRGGRMGGGRNFRQSTRK